MTSRFWVGKKMMVNTFRNIPVLAIPPVLINFVLVCCFTEGTAALRLLKNEGHIINFCCRIPSVIEPSPSHLHPGPALRQSENVIL